MVGLELMFKTKVAAPLAPFGISIFPENVAVPQIFPKQYESIDPVYLSLYLYNPSLRVTGTVTPLAKFKLPERR